MGLALLDSNTVIGFLDADDLLHQAADAASSGTSPRPRRRAEEVSPSRLAATGGRARSLRYAAAAMLVLGNALGFTLSLLAIFGGIGVLVNVLIVYAVAQVIEEHRDNEERKRRDRG